MIRSKGYADSRYLQASGAVLNEMKQRSVTLMHVQPGHTVLDLGCGPGIDTIPLGTLVGPTGRVVGIDHDPEMIAEANQRAAEAHMQPWVQHELADAAALPFDAATFDSCHSERVFQHLLDPEAVFAEMVRVTRPNGWIVIVDIDYGTMSIDTPEVDIERRLVRVHAELTLHNGYAGRQLYRLFQQQHLQDIKVEIFPIPVTSYAMARYLGRLDAPEQEALEAGIVTEEELQRWRASLEQADATGIFFGSVSMIMVAGRKA